MKINSFIHKMDLNNQRMCRRYFFFLESIHYTKKKENFKFRRQKNEINSSLK